MFRLASSLLAALAIFTPAIRAQTLDQVFGTHLGNSQTLQGEQQSVTPFTMTVLTNETHAVIALNMTETSMSRAGWIAIGTGTSMANSDMIIAWPNNDGSWTLSQRSASGHSMPAAVSPQPAASDLTIIPALTTNSSSSPFACVAFLRPLSVSSAYAAANGNANLQRASGQRFIYAASGRNPASNDQSSSIVQHDQDSFGNIRFDLTKVVAANAVAPAAAPAAADTSAPWTRRDSIIVLHALCGGLAWLIIAPAAVLLARIGRHFQGWFRLHQLLQSVLVGALTLAAVILGAVAVNESGGKHANTTHKAMGYALIALLLIQYAIGMWAHKLFDANRTKRPIRNVLHIVIGISLITLGYIQSYKGFGQYARATPGYVLAAFWVSLAGFVIVYVFSCLRLAQVRHEQGMGWSHAAMGLGRDQDRRSKRNSPFGQEKNIGNLDYFSQPDPLRHGGDVKLQPVGNADSMATHERFTPTPPLRLNNRDDFGSRPAPTPPAAGLPSGPRPANRRPIEDQPQHPAYDQFSRPGWTTFPNRTDTDLPYADSSAPSQRLPNAYPHFGVAR